ncbi:MAG: response regulator [Candidatus Hydrothermales bacterium]
MKPEKRILIVEDEKLLGMALYEILFSATGAFEVVLCETAEEGLDKIKEKKFDLVISDLKLPGQMNGMDLLKIVKEKYPDTHLILMTAYGSEAVHIEAEKIGVEAYFEKPFKLKEFVNKVLNILGIEGKEG